MKKTICNLAFAHFAVLVFGLTLSAQALKKAETDQIDKYIRFHLSSEKVPAISIAVLRDGKVLLAKGYGTANVETNTAADADTIFKIGSLSKQFIAAATMVLAQQGKIDVNQPIKSYLSDLPASWDDIKVRNLLTHTSGLIRDIPEFNPFKIESNWDSIKRVFPVKLGFAPGEKWQYSNVNYYLLAEIVQKVSGKPWDKFIDESIFKAASMNHTRTTTATDIVPGRASGYEGTDTGLENAEAWIALRPSGAFLSSVVDLAKWDAALFYSDSILNAESKKMMWTRATLNDGKPAPYGFGWFIDEINGDINIHHDGALPGFRADYEHYQKARITVIVLGNSGDSNSIKIARKVAAIIDPRLKPIRKSIADTEPNITALVNTLIRQLIENKPDDTMFSADLLKKMNKDSNVQFGKYLAAPGKINSVILIDKKVNGDKRVYRYELTYEQDTHVLAVEFDAQDKITNFGTTE